METIITRFDGTFLIGQIDDDTVHPNVLRNPAQVIYLPMSIQGRVSGTQGLAFNTSVVFIGVTALRIPNDVYTTILGSGDPLYRHYHNSLVKYRQALIEEAGRKGN